MIDIQRVPDLDDELKARVERGFQEYHDTLDDPVINTRNRRIFGLHAVDDAGRIVGVISAKMDWNWLYIKTLWVDAPARQKGVARALLDEAERIGRENKCTDVHLISFSFQAADFYKKLGYEEFARLDNFPAGHARVYLKKKL